MITRVGLEVELNYQQETSIHFDMYRNYISNKKNCSNCLFLQQFPGKLLLPPLFHHSASHRVLQQHSDTLSANSDITELAVWHGTGRREFHSLASGLIQLLATRENSEDRAKKSPSGYKLCSTKLASFPGPAQLSVTSSTEKWERAWYLFSRE